MYVTILAIVFLFFFLMGFVATFSLVYYYYNRHFKGMVGQLADYFKERGYGKK